MENRTKKVIIFIIIFLTSFLTLVPSLFAQEAESRFKQKLEWKADSSAFEYKVEIKSLQSGEVINYNTTSNSISFSLASGEYQWRVTAYDFLGRVASISDWMNFSIKKAIAPEIKKAEPVVNVVKNSSEKKFSIPLEAEKIEEEAKVVLINEETNKEVEGKIENEQAVFPKVEAGTWKMKVTNPGGLTSESEKIEISMVSKIDSYKKLDMFLMAGVDYRLFKTLEQYLVDFGTDIISDFNVDINLKFEYLPINVNGYKIGFGLEYTPTMFAIPVGIPDYENLLVVINPLMINAIGLIPLYKENIYCGVKLGAGPNLSVKFWINEGDFSDPVGYIAYGIRSGAFIRFIAGKSFAVDVGLDYSYWNISKGFDNHSIMGYCSLGIRL